MIARFVNGNEFFCGHLLLCVGRPLLMELFWDIQCENLQGSETKDEDMSRISRGPCQESYSFISTFVTTRRRRDVATISTILPELVC